MTKQPKERIDHFIENHLIDKVLTTDTTKYSLEAGKLEGEYFSTVQFSRLVRSRDGLAFDLNMINKERVFLIEKGAKKLVKERSKENVNVFRYELAERKSTSEIVGISRIVHTTLPNQEVMAWALGQFNIKQNQMTWQERQILYRDMTYTSGKFKPLAQDAEARIEIRDGKIKFEYIIDLFDITNPETLERQASKDKLPAFVFKES